MPGAFTSTNTIIFDALESFGLGSGYNLETVASSGDKYVCHATRHIDGVGFAVHVAGYGHTRFVDNEEAIFRQLSVGGIKSTYSLKNKHGDYIYRTGKRTITISPWIGGQHPAVFAIPSDMCEVLGKTLSSFHTLVTDLPHSNKLQLLPTDVRTWWGANTLLHDNNAARALWDIAKSIKIDGLPIGIVHGDFHALNILLNNDRISILDLERSGSSILVLDAARASIDLCANGNEFSAEKNKAFLKGYESNRILEKDERAMYKPAISYAALGVANWFAQNANTNMAEHFLKIGISALKVV